MKSKAKNTDKPKVIKITKIKTLFVFFIFSPPPALFVYGYLLFVVFSCFCLQRKPTQKTNKNRTTNYDKSTL